MLSSERQEKQMLVMTWRKADPFILTVVMQTGTVTMENNINVPQKIKKIELLYHPVVPFLCIYPKEAKSLAWQICFFPLTWKDISTFIFTVALFTIAKTWKQQKEIIPFVITWMNMEGIVLGTMSQTDKYKWCMISFIYGILKKKKLNL